MSNHISLNPDLLKPLRETDPALTSYNIEMTEVTGGTFWRSYTPEQVAGLEPFVLDADMNSKEKMMEVFPPINLYEPRIRTLAAALGSVWVRVSGTWSVKTYYDFDGHTGGIAPEGFESVMTKKQWNGVLDFVKAVNGRLLVSVANCSGVHDEDGRWNPSQAKLLFDYSRDYGVPISAAEFMNEPNLMTMGGAPEGYTCVDLCRDQDLFFRFLRENYPDVLLVAPGATCDTDEDSDNSEEVKKLLESLHIVSTNDIMKGCQILPDIFSYHYYNGTSERGAGMGGHWKPEEALSEEYLDTCASSCRLYKKIRDHFCPGAPMWVTESGDAACGGNTWASTYLDVFRTANEFGRFSTMTHGVIFHNTLASSDYGLLDRKTHLPRPNYWVTWLWSQLMGSTVYDTKEPLRTGAHIYCHSRKDGKAGFAYLLINTSREEALVADVPRAFTQYTLSATAIRSTEILLNGTPLHMVDDHTLPVLHAEKQTAGQVCLPPATVSFLVVD